MSENNTADGVGARGNGNGTLCVTLCESLQKSPLSLQSIVLSAGPDPLEDMQ